ncbi:MAG: iron ABC transporter permease [Prevotella sp.]|nr:iron ABC transporter permease [Prevotella sp.]
MKHSTIICLVLCLSLIPVVALSLCTGSVDIPVREVALILMGRSQASASWQFIILESRMPQTLTALLSGAALAVSGLLLQTAFRNPLAGPSIFGINSGAGLGVALVMLLLGGSIQAGSYNAGGYAAILVGAFAGAMAVTGIIFFFSNLVQGSVMLLIIGIMIGYLASSGITLLNFFASEEGVRSFMVWGMGSFNGVSRSQLPLFSTLILAGLFGAAMLVKPLNALILGEDYASNLGVNIVRTRNLLLLTTGLLTAVTTAFCGPIAFIGLAVPHIARLLLGSENHRVLLPATLLCGSIVALLCSIISFLPGSNGIIPINAVTPLIGAPVIIYIIVKKR